MDTASAAHYCIWWLQYFRFSASLHRAFETRLAESIHMVGEISDQGRSQADVKRTALGGLKATKKGKVGVKRIGNATLGMLCRMLTVVSLPLDYLYNTTHYQ